MKRKKSTIPSRIYRYGLPFGPDPECFDAVDEQIRLGHRYQNKLVEIERRRRERYRTEELKIGDLKTLKEVADQCKEDYEAAKGMVKADRQRTRKRKADPALMAKKKAALVAKKEAYAALKEAKQKVRESKVLAKDSEIINEEAGAEIRAARAVCDVYWGTYVRVEKAMEQVRSKKGTDPEFKRYVGKGSIGVQIQGGMRVEELFSGRDTRLRIDPVPADTYLRTRAYRRLNSRTKVYMRIGSDQRKPVWATFPLVLHRPLPSDADIKWAWVQRRKIGLRWRWELCIQFESSIYSVPQRASHTMCAIDIGWRKMDDDLTLRVGYIVGSDGHREELILPGEIYRSLKHCDHLRSIQDRLYDEIRAQLQKWLKAQPDVPEWLKNATEYLPLWKSAKRMRWLLGDWRAARFPGDEEIVSEIEKWRHKWRHLYGWECNQRSRTYGRRKEYYRLLARRLAKRYGTIVIEIFDLAKMAKLEPVEETTQEKPQRRQRTVVGLYEFREALTLAAGKLGSAIVHRPSEYTTVTCHDCGGLCDWDAGKYLVHACEHCGATWDQDANAARNLLFGMPKK
jgi:hypothetical protein